jgi:hypothetical protein
MLRRLAAACLPLVVACSTAESVAPAGATASAAGGAGGGAGGGVGGAGGRGGASPALVVTLPQARAGAMLANPTTYAAIPVHVVVGGGRATAVTVTVAGASHDAVDADGDGTWDVALPIAGMADGAAELRAEAIAPGAEKGAASADLVIASEGARLTVFDDVGLARSPRLHDRDGQRWLTWVDRSADDRRGRLWMRAIDGGGRFVGEKRELVASAASELLYGDVAFGAASIGVLYKEPGAPYVSFFKTVGYDGAELSAPIALVPEGASGTFGGDVAWDGGAFVVAWRVATGGASEIRWLRFDEVTKAVTGPVVVAASGDGTKDDPIGGFEPFSFVKVATRGTLSVVSFARARFSAMLDNLVPKSELAVVHADGSVEPPVLIDPSEVHWHRESRVFSLGGELLSIHSAQNLAAPVDAPPMLFFAARLDASGRPKPKGTAGVAMFDAVDDRDEPTIVPTPGGAALAWLDHRRYTLDPANGHIDLFVAPLGDDLRTKEPTVIRTVSFSAGLAELSGAATATNVELTWVDFRHSVGMTYKPEAWLDVAWW